MNVHDRHKAEFSGSYRDTGYLFGNGAYTCCHNCTKQDACPGDANGRKCTREQRTCTTCTQWNRRGCRNFVLDWGIMKI